MTEIRVDIVASGATINTCRIVGMVPESIEPEDFSLYVSTVGSTVRVTRSDTDAVIVSAVGFTKAMVALADHYGVPVIVALDYQVPATAKTRAMVGTYRPTAPEAVVTVEGWRERREAAAAHESALGDVIDAAFPEISERTASALLDLVSFDAELRGLADDMGITYPCECGVCAPCVVADDIWAASLPKLRIPAPVRTKLNKRLRKAGKRHAFAR